IFIQILPLLKFLCILMGIQQGDQTAPAASSGISDPLVQKFGQLHVLDDLIRHRAADFVQRPILAYPNSENDAASYSYYTGQDLDQMIDQVASVLMVNGFQPPKRNGCTVALLTLSDLNMVITFFALSRLGYAVMMLSPRLSAEACVSLLDSAQCDTIIYGSTGSTRTTMGEILQRKLLSCRPMPVASLDTSETSLFVLHRNRNPEVQKNKVALILHSSGSTGTPKPLYLTHRALMTHPLRGPGLTSFNPLPWYHLHGISTALQAMWMRKTAYMWNAAIPLTAQPVVSVLEVAQPESVAAVPYMLQLLVDSPRGIDCLRRCQLVTYGGAPCPDELGDRLVREGVKFSGSFGLTEAGLVAESISRPEGDPFWNYLKFFENIRPYIWMKPIGDSLYECVYLAGHPALTTSNSNEPPGSFHSKDVFTPHPTIPNRWKYASRLDDRVTLVNGEKVLPLPIEGFIKQNSLIHEAVIVGLGKVTPGLLVIRSQEAESLGLSDQEFLQAIWPTVEEANSRAERFSQISIDLVAILPFDSKFPRTDKGSMIRAQVYLLYADLIDSIYAQAEKVSGNLQLSLVETKSFLEKLCRDELRISLSSVEANFFAEGFDSLRAIQLRRLILQKFYFENQEISLNMVYDSGSIACLAANICALQQGESVTSTEDDQTAISNLIQKYSSFQNHIAQPSPYSNSKSVVLTGATGSIGAHVLHELLKDDSISVVYCLTRKTSSQEAVLQSLIERDLHLTVDQISKIISLHSILDQKNLGLDEETFDQIQSTTTHIIHAAWPVNFNLPLSEFESHIHGLHSLIQLSLSVPQSNPAVLMFCSSISTTLRSVEEVPEAPANLTEAYMGYGQSKLIGEHIVANARNSGANAYSLRIGQVSGHSKKGLWNDSEALPLLIRSALTLKVMPDLSLTCSWIPVDKLASIIVEIVQTCTRPSSRSNPPDSEGSQDENHTSSFIPEKITCGQIDSVYNVCNSREFTWSAMLSTLKQNGFQFEIVSFEKWMRRLRESEERGEEHINPAVKLIDHYEEMYGAGSKLGPKGFITEKAERDSVTLRNGRLRVIEDGILNCYVRGWMNRWMKA
ncbi:AMP-dependent synthetase/ligase, partial [Penicillium waksmanii]|uniref:AMP-dependent synthetase/ligase n=1 Tax=Penicillium waksmanii TaxID=69791 RepID=UPI0025483542